MALSLLVLLFAVPQEKLDLRERWVYAPFNLNEQKNVEKVIGLMRRAARVDYNAFALEDPSFGKLPLMGPRYFENCRRVKREAQRLGLRIVPGLFQLGHSQNLLAQDPNLAAAMPVKDALFVVKNGAATLQADPPVSFPDRWSWKDPIVSDDLAVENPGGKYARVTWKVRVKPFRQYHVSARLRTRNFTGLPRIVVTGGGRLLTYKWTRAEATSDNNPVQHAVFNPLEAELVRITLGSWDTTTGTFQWADPMIEEIGLFNLVRRDGAPLSVRIEGGRELVEGRDFERLEDPGLPKILNSVQHQEWHEPPVLRTSLPDGTRLRVSYYHTQTLRDHGQTPICLSEPKTVEILRDQAERMHALWNAKAYLMTHDEIRIMNWDESCRKRNLTPGQIVADNARTCVRILKEINPGGEIYVWSDMWDPYHNAHDGPYYLVRGSYKGTWEGLDKDVIIANWYFDRREENMPWFASRGHRQLIAGYYDKLPGRARDWLESAKKIKGVVGIMYTSWYDKYEDLETWARIVNEHR